MQTYHLQFVFSGSDGAQDEQPLSETFAADGINAAVQEAWGRFDGTGDRPLNSATLTCAAGRVLWSMRSPQNVTIAAA